MSETNIFDGMRVVHISLPVWVCDTIERRRKFTKNSFASQVREILVDGLRKDSDSRKDEVARRKLDEAEV